MHRIARRTLVLGGLGGLATAAVGCRAADPAVRTLPTAAPLSPKPGQRVVTRTLRPGPATLDLGGVRVDTWAYDAQLPGPLLRATAGDLVRVTVENQLPEDTTVHWHGIALRNAADGIPGVTQDPIGAGSTYVYEFVPPDPGTYWYHSHVGLQLDRGLYAPLIIDDPAEPGAYDDEWVVVLDDWVDGTGRTPDDVLAELTAGGADGHDHGWGGAHAGMDGMDMGGMDGMDAQPPPFGRSDVDYPHYLVNGRVPADPETFSSRPGRRVRIRLVNAAADTIFTVALGGHTMTVTHTDGFAVVPTRTDALYLGMGERYDVLVTLDDGVFPLVAQPFGKSGRALALVRTGAGAAPPADVRPAELDGRPLQGSRLAPQESALLPARDDDDTQSLMLSGRMSPYSWGINGGPHGLNEPIEVTEGQRVRFAMMNHTSMTHPMHVHGHTFALESGLRKDTVLVPPMSAMSFWLQADNPGQWMAHCHNAYHMEAGMMIDLNYRT